MKNSTNIKKYKRISASYDRFFGSPIFDAGREQAFSLLSFDDIDDVLVMGVGTGCDIPFIPRDKTIKAIDLSPDMLEVCKSKYPKLETEVMDAENLKFKDESFDLVVMNLLVSVVEEPKNALSEAARVLNQDGTILVFDKFVNDNERVPFKRKILNIITRFFGTDINRKFESMNIPELRIHSCESSILNGEYKVYVLKKAVNKS